MEIRIDAGNAQAILALFERTPDIAKQELSAGVLEAQLLLVRELKDAAPTGATESLRGSISAKEPKVLANSVIGEVGTSIGHALPVELGTKPHFPPLAPLRDWVKSKLDVEAEQVDNVAYMIARKIAARGTEARHFFEDTIKATEGQVQTIFIRSVDRITERLSHG